MTTEIPLRRFGSSRGRVERVQLHQLSSSSENFFGSPCKNQPASSLRMPAGALMMWKIVILVPSSSYLRPVGARRVINTAAGEVQLCGQDSHGGRE